MLQAIDLTKRYEDGNLALDSLNLEIKPGEIFFFLGANGAGKTTTINLFLNFLEPSSGQALIDGIDVMKNPLETKNHVAFVSENVMLYGNFTARQNLSFITLLFSFDAISGEKEERTLALVFSNAVPRRTFLCSKLLSVVTIIGMMELIGIVLSLLILTLAGGIQLDAAFMMETAGFIVISLLFITTIAAFGLFSSVVTRYSNVSLLISLCFWLFAAVIVPNTSVFWAKKLFTIPSSEEVNQKREEAKQDINKNAPEGSWSASGRDPFYPRHELRARNQMNMMLSDKKYNDAYYQQQFRQFEQTRNFTLLSPIAQFDYMNEAFLGGGYLRFQKNWSDMHLLLREV